MLCKFNKIMVRSFKYLDNPKFISIYGYSWGFMAFLFLIINFFIGGVHCD